MFEKEAEEYREKEKDKGYYWVTQEMEQSELDTIIDESFKDGAEFGYNKAFVEADKNLKAVVADFNKANEWHYVKDGDLPKDEKLCLIWCGKKDFNTVEYVRKRVWDLCGGWLEVDEVIAWKEIVLPKESEAE